VRVKRKIKMERREEQKRNDEIEPGTGDFKVRIQSDRGALRFLYGTLAAGIWR
jgi:hypothetical protein